MFCGVLDLARSPISAMGGAEKKARKRKAAEAAEASEEDPPQNIDIQINGGVKERKPRHPKKAAKLAKNAAKMEARYVVGSVCQVCLALQ